MLGGRIDHLYEDTIPGNQNMNQRMELYLHALKDHLMRPFELGAYPLTPSAVVIRTQVRSRGLSAVASDGRLL